MEMKDRLRLAREAAGFASATEAAEILSVKAAAYTHHENGTRNFHAHVVEYAKAFKVSLEWLLTGKGEMKPKTRKDIDGVDSHELKFAPVRGVAQAGSWQEYEDFDFDHLDPVPCVPGRWAGLEQFAHKAAGTSANRAGILDGDFVVCVPYFLARTSLTDGDMVVAERRDGARKERTIKRLRISPTAFELWPESFDPKHQEPLRVIRNTGLHDETGIEIEIVGLVIGRYAPM